MDHIILHTSPFLYSDISYSISSPPPDMACTAAYRKVALEFHPDKAGAAVADEDKKRQIEQHFQKIQDAYETLSDPATRREYDSTDDFDDTLPSSAPPEEYFKVWSASLDTCAALDGTFTQSTLSACTLLSFLCVPACPASTRLAAMLWVLAWSGLPAGLGLLSNLSFFGFGKNNLINVIFLPG